MRRRVYLRRDQGLRLLPRRTCGTGATRRPRLAISRRRSRRRAARSMCRRTSRRANPSANVRTTTPRIPRQRAAGYETGDHGLETDPRCGRVSDDGVMARGGAPCATWHLLFERGRGPQTPFSPPQCGFGQSKLAAAWGYETGSQPPRPNGALSSGRAARFQPAVARRGQVVEQSAWPAVSGHRPLEASPMLHSLDSDSKMRSLHEEGRRVGSLRRRPRSSAKWLLARDEEAGRLAGRAYSVCRRGSIFARKYVIYPGIIVDHLPLLKRKRGASGRPRDGRVTCGSASPS